MDNKDRPSAFRSSSFSSPLPAAERAPETPKTASAMRAVFSPSPTGKGLATPTRPSLSSSTSMPTLTMAEPQTLVPSPSSPLPQSLNTHPYRIRTSSSGVLSRSNTSPAQPLVNLSGHRSSRSMSNLKEVVDAQDAASGDGDQATPVKDLSKRRSMDGTPAAWSGGLRSRVGGPVHQRRQSHSRNGSIRSMDGVSDGSQADVKRKALGIPAVSASASVNGLSPSVKTWSAADLSQYIVFTLAPANPSAATDTPRRPRKPLNAGVVEDICIWIVEQNIQGRSFLRGAESHWANAGKQPPFLPILLSLSRNLRRASLKGNVLDQERGHYYLRQFSPEEHERSYSKTTGPGLHRHTRSKDGSVLREEDEGGSDTPEVLTPLTEEALQSLVAVTGEFDSAVASEDGESLVAGDVGARDSTGPSKGNASGHHNGTPGLLDGTRSQRGPLVRRRQRRSSETSTSSAVSVGVVQTATIKAPATASAGLSSGMTSLKVSDQKAHSPPTLSLQTPPPAYEIQEGQVTLLAGIPGAIPLDGVESVGLGIQGCEDTPRPQGAADNVVDHASSKNRTSYGALNNGIHAKRLPGQLQSGPESPADGDYSDRRVTIRAGRSVTPKAKASSRLGRADSSGISTPDDEEKVTLRRIVEDLSARLQAAEARLERLDQPAEDVHYVVTQTMSLRDRILLRGGYLSPRSKRDLPLYLVLVGIGVGIVVSRVVFGRANRG